MRTNLLILCILLFINVSFAQNEAAVWYFGDSAGLDFKPGNPLVLTNSAMHAEAGCAVINNKNGDLQFYTNGKEVWNRQHQTMPNGFGLNGSQILNQNSIIVPLPASGNIYYLFTINAYYDSVGLNYSVVNMDLEAGLGDVEIKNRFMFQGLIEKITAAKHCNGEDTWIVTHDRFDGYYSFLLTADGLVADTVRSFTGNKIRSDIGYMKMSPASNRIALPLNQDNLLVELCLFHNRSGKVYDPIRIFAKDETVYAYGIEFSADGNLLYIATGGRAYKVWQYDLRQETEEKINNSATLIAEGNHFALQLGTDGKIYMARTNRAYLSVIHFPERAGPACDLEENAINLQGKNSLMGLPNFMPYLFYKPSFSVENPCLGDTTRFHFNQFFTSDSLSWDFGDGSPPLTSKDNAHPSYLYSNTGTYSVKLLIHHCGIADTAKMDVQIFPLPEVFLGNDTSLCNSCTILLDGGEGMDNWLWQDGSEERFYEVRQSGSYNVLVIKDGCSATDSIFINSEAVKVVLPSAFTPNGDGRNDVFMAIANEPLPEYHLLIFNRRGGLIFESHRIENGWDGRYRGSFSPPGVYTWQIIYSYYFDGSLKTETKQGTVLLLR
ncbi:MAG: gliding motility-associated C-terminal domain-containing protein [Bacteroidales bacterium]|nr:gliding motility-associated C-terminal domain-containing protein [Bacteroidales bacterium]